MSHHKIRTLVVDDSVFYRGILGDTLKKMSQVEYLGHAANGKLALAKIEESPPDLITLDVEMPGMNGIEVLQKVKEKFPEVQVVMISAATQESAENTIEALNQGALDFIIKPTGGDQEANERQLYRELRKVLSIVETKIILKRGKGLDPSIQNSYQAPTDETLSENRWPESRNNIDIVAIGISTGGPQALPEVLEKLPSTFNLPIIIVQHLPALFVSVLVNSLNLKSKLKVVEVRENLPLEPGVVHIAPGGCHTKIVRKPGVDVPVATLTQDPPENFCRPSVDYMFRSVADIYREKVLAVIMTGMGKDGVAGMKLLKSYGASTIAQDEATSVVFGMPMEAINAGVVDRVAPLNKIADVIVRRVGNNN
jgi:two-component system chemotaxis response regulator CheB